MNWTQVPGVLASLVLAAGGVSVAHAQPIETITYSIEWEKGVIAPGETNTATVWAMITPDIGTLVMWNPGGGGTGQAGFLKAFAATIFDFVSVSNGDNGAIVEAFVPEEFAITPDSITPIGTAGVKAKAGQFPFPTNPNPNVGQSVAVLSFTWQAGAVGGGYDVLYAAKGISA